MPRMMKVIALLLAVFVSFLVLKPGIDAAVAHFSEAEQVCCNTACTPFSDEEAPQEEEGGCMGKNCNPFQACSSGIILTGKVLSFEAFIRPIAVASLPFSNDSAFPSSYISDIWHPPKVV